MLLALMLPCALLAQRPSIDPDLAAWYFREAKAFADEDAGRLWGMRLDGPMLFVDASTRTTVANQEPPMPGFAKVGEVWLGKLPDDQMIANTAIEFKGGRWSMVMWPLPTTRNDRNGLMAHELFHRIQSEVGLPPDMIRNNHLDTMDGRLWLQLEIKALRQAMLAEKEERTPFIEDALVMRGYRQSLFPTSQKSEDRMEVHEGMAEYTGVMMRGTSERETRYGLASRMLGFPQRRSFPNSFAYETGPAYGLLLNSLAPPAWNRSLKPDSSLAGEVANRISYRTPKSLSTEALKRAKPYGYADLLKSEGKREEVRVAKERAYRAALIDGPVLILPLTQLNFSYDPGGVFPLGASGTVYPEASVGDAWGKIVVTKGVLIASDFKTAWVSAPKNGDPTQTDGWKLELQPGWRLAPGQRKGDWTLTK